MPAITASRAATLPIGELSKLSGVKQSGTMSGSRCWPHPRAQPAVVASMT